MPKLPYPPTVDELKSIDPEEVCLPAGTDLARIYSAGGDYPSTWNEFRHWGPTTSRFDHHLLDSKDEPHFQSRGMLYAAGNDVHGALATCLAEVFQTRRKINRSRNDPFFTVFQTTRDLRLLNLKDLWPTRAGASAAIATGPKRTSRMWAKAIYETYPDLDGVLYGSSMAGMADAMALFERAEDVMPPSPRFNRALVDKTIQRELFSAADKIGYIISDLIP